MAPTALERENFKVLSRTLRPPAPSPPASRSRLTSCLLLNTTHLPPFAAPDGESLLHVHVNELLEKFIFFVFFVF